MIPAATVPVLLCIFLVIGCQPAQPRATPEMNATEVTDLPTTDVGVGIESVPNATLAVQSTETGRLEPTGTSPQGKNQMVHDRAMIKAQQHYDKGIEFSGRRLHDQAIQEYDRAIGLDPDFAKAYNSRGLAYSQLGQHRTAVGNYRKAIELDPNLTDAYRNRGLAYPRAYGGNSAARRLALEDFTQAVMLEPENAENYILRGHAYAKVGQFQLAFEDFSQAVKLDPQNALAYAKRGDAQSSLGKHQLGFEDFKMALGLDPDLAEAYAGRGKAKKRVGRTDGSSDIKKACDLDKSFCPRPRVLMHPPRRRPSPEEIMQRAERNKLPSLKNIAQWLGQELATREWERAYARYSDQFKAKCGLGDFVQLMKLTLASQSVPEDVGYSRLVVEDAKVEGSIGTVSRRFEKVEGSIGPVSRRFLKLVETREKWVPAEFDLGHGWPGAPDFVWADGKWTVFVPEDELAKDNPCTSAATKKSNDTATPDNLEWRDFGNHIVIQASSLPKLLGEPTLTGKIRVTFHGHESIREIDDFGDRRKKIKTDGQFVVLYYSAVNRLSNRFKPSVQVNEQLYLSDDSGRRWRPVDYTGNYGRVSANAAILGIHVLYWDQLQWSSPRPWGIDRGIHVNPYTTTEVRKGEPERWVRPGVEVGTAVVFDVPTDAQNLFLIWERAGAKVLLD